MATRGKSWADTIWRIATAVLPVVLAIAGVAVTFWAPATDPQKFVWLLVFALGGVAAIIAVLQQQGVVTRSHRRLMRAITGGDNYCFLTVDPERGNQAGGFYLIMTATDAMREVNYWISPASAKRDPKNPEYFSISRPLIQTLTIHKGRRYWAPFLMPGDYYIEFDAINGLKHWIERLTIMHNGNDLEQTVLIEHPATGKIVLDIKTLTTVTSMDA